MQCDGEWLLYYYYDVIIHAQLLLMAGYQSCLQGLRCMFYFLALLILPLDT